MFSLGITVVSEKLKALRHLLGIWKKLNKQDVDIIFL